MSGISSLTNSTPRKLVAAMGMLLAAAAVAVGSGADFNSTSANASNVLSAGNIAQTNSKGSAAILTAALMKPGGTSTGTVDIKNTGDIAGTFTLTKSNLVDTPASPPFSTKLTVVIEDMGDPACVTSCPAAVSKYSGTIGAMGTIAMGSFAAGVTHQYKFTVTFPDGGAGGADNAYKNASTSLTYNWTSTS
jgi:spore coat-associated protein N